MPVTRGMIGHGFYDRNSAPQLSSIAHVLPWLDDAVEALSLDAEGGAVGLADFGCSEGRNSIAVMRHLIDACRRSTARPIQTIHSDLPTNDFSELFLHLAPPDGDVWETDNVFSAAVGGSMFDQLLPPGSVTVATTFNAIGFLSRRPVERLADYILPNGPSQRGGVGAVSGADRTAFAAQARADVTAFATARAAELVPGGKLLVQVFGAGDERRTCDGIYDVLNDAVLDAEATGMIGRDAYETYYQPVYFRTLDELVAPFSDKASPLSDLFTLERAETYEVPVPFVETFHETGDVAQYAAAYTDFFRAFTEEVLRLNFADHPDLQGLVDYVYARAQSRVRADPDRYPFHYVAIAALLTRNG